MKYFQYHIHHLLYISLVIIMLTAKSSYFFLAGLVLILFAFPFQACSRNLNVAPLDSSGAPKVDLALYYESLCPGCADFIVQDLINVFNSDLISIVNLKLVPWGNAIVDNGTVQCQHGPDECKVNTIEACVINTWPDVGKHFPYIHCIEAVVSKSSSSSKDLQSCFPKSADWKSVDSCYRSGLGSKLEEKHRKDTEALNPPHEYVPWVLVNNVPLKDDIDNYVQYVCKAYKGPQPKACKSAKRKFKATENENTGNQVCHVDKQRAKIIT